MKIPAPITEMPEVSEEATLGVIEEAAQSAAALVAGGYAQDIYVPAEIQSGAEFIIDLLVPEEWETGDGRTFKADSLTTSDFPMTLYWQVLTGPGHDGSAIIGRIDYAERLEEDPDAERTVVFLEDGSEVEGTTTPPKKGWGRARGVFDTGVYGREAERLVRGGFLRGVSVDLDKFLATTSPEPAAELSELDSDVETIKSEKIEISEARIIAATLTGKPAFQECTIRIYEPELEVEDDMALVEDGEYVEDSDDIEDAFAVLTASAAPIVPPREWFDNPGLTKLTPITVEDDGKVFGHIASWESSHIGMAGKIKPPRSKSNYAYFKTGVVRTDDGSDVPVGQLTLSGGHAGMTLSARDAVKHYDDTASAVVDVTIGEDRYGIWVAGALRPEATPSQVRALRASAPSGDWRPIQGRLELVAACCVNVPGFPVTRTLVAGGQVHALVAAGARSVAELRDPVRELEDRIRAIEHKEFSARINNLENMRHAVEQRDRGLVASAAEARRKILGPTLAEEREALKNRIK